MPTPMPTAAKLAAAFLFAVFGWLAANAFTPVLAEGKPIGIFREYVAVIGFFSGWLVMGNLVGRGYVDAVFSGFRTTIVAVFFALLILGAYRMIQLAYARQYDGLGDALAGVFWLMWEYLQAMATVGVVGVLVIGSIVAGCLSEWVARRWS